jgi:hypothetical protein
MSTMPASRAARPGRGRVPGGCLAALAVATLAVAAGCAGGPAASASGGTTAAGPGHVVSGSSGGQGDTSTGGFTLAFAKCMRAHGVPGFPDPDGPGDQLGPGSGVNPASRQYQAAISGPCLSLAPAGWVGPGPLTR